MTDKVPTILMGVGLALIPIQRLHAVPAAVGFGLVLIAVTCIIVTQLKRHELSLGPKYIYIPLAVVVLSALLAQGDLASKLLSISLFATYIAAVNLREELKLLGLAVLVGCVSVIIYNLLSSDREGGMYQLDNYNLATGAIIMGVVLFRSRYHWILATVAVIGLFFTGAEEVLIAAAILGLVVLVRRDWSKKSLLPTGVLTLILIVCTSLGMMQQLWDSASVRIVALTNDNLHVATNGRISAWEHAVADIEPLGHGYAPFNVRTDTVHNVPLRILYELGPAAALAWLFALAYLFVKTKRKYIPAAILALCLFDHFLWTQLCVYMFVAIGIATRSSRVSDLIFRREVNT